MNDRLSFGEAAIGWVVLTVLSVALGAAIDSFVRMDLTWPWEWGRAGRAMIVFFAFFWAWVLIAAACDKK